MSTNLNEEDWNRLLRRIKDHKCTPFLGAGASAGTLPLGSEIALEWAQEYCYPLQDSHDLARVAQFRAVTARDYMAPKEDIAARFKQIPAPNFADPDEPHGILADLKLPIYITTNYDHFMVRALRSRRADPKQEICRWNRYVRDEHSIFELEAGFMPTPANPVVFHLHGHYDIPESLVLTEDDYLDFLVNISRDQDLLPPRIRRAFTGSTLLFVGYKIADWDFRVLFRSLVGYLENAVKRAHLSVQLTPSGERYTDAQEYLCRYFEKLDIKIYWGTARQFAAELRKRWEEFNRG